MSKIKHDDFKRSKFILCYFIIVMSLYKINCLYIKFNIFVNKLIISN